MWSKITNTLNATVPTFSMNSPANERHQFLSDGGTDYPKQTLLMPYQPKDLKGKEKAVENEEPQEVVVQITAPKFVNETMFHVKEKSPELSPPFHEQSQSFFYSMANSETKVDKGSISPVNVVTSSTDHKPASGDSHQAPPTSSAKTRTRSMSDIVFQTMLRSSSSEPRQPKTGSNEESTTGIVIHSGGTSEPDPFSAHANTYYTPQTMIPPTPPNQTLKHVRKTSKEESLIISLQTQLAFQTELCGHYEADLKARDELIGVLGKKLADLEKDDTKHKNALRSWKKKGQELERACRQLEETVEDSRQESMERSVIDEASSEALRLLHRQIASLQMEKNQWSKREQGLCEEVNRLEESLRTKDAEISQVTQRVLERASEVENLHEEISTIKREHAHNINEQTKALRDAACREDESKARVDQLVRVKAEADVEIKSSRDRIIVLKEEVEGLRRHVHSLQQESAHKEVKIVQMTKQHPLDKKDLQGLNIALDSKQQELELLKKNNSPGVKGTAPQPSKVAHRRDSSIFTAIPILSRSSVLSESGTDTMHIPKKERIISSEIAPPSAKLFALGKSTRVNGSMVRAGIDGSIMGPPPLKSPPLKSRPSTVGTLIPSAKGLSLPRSSSATTTIHRRDSSVNIEQKMKTKISRMAVNPSAAPSVLGQDEKENVDDTSSRRRTHTRLASRFIIPN